MKKINVTIPTPCNENWDSMLPEEKGRFCQSCAKTVVDFTNSSPEEIIDYFIKNKESKTCGRFKREQLKEIQIEIPINIIYQQTSFRNVFMLALFISMGTTLFSCKDYNNKTQPVSKIVLIDDSLSLFKDSLISPTNNLDTTNHIEGLKGTNKIQKSFPILVGVVEVEPTIIEEEIMMGDVIQEPVEIDTEKIYNALQVDKKPEFPGGETKLNQYILENLSLTEPVVPELMLVQFIITTEGKLEDIKVVRGKDKVLKDKIINLFQNASLWKPAELQGEKVKVQMIYPIRIKSQ
jgi:hypothetical protein